MYRLQQWELSYRLKQWEPLIDIRQSHRQRIGRSNLQLHNESCGGSLFIRYCIIHKWPNSHKDLAVEAFCWTFLKYEGCHQRNQAARRSPQSFGIMQTVMLQALAVQHWQLYR